MKQEYELLKDYQDVLTPKDIKEVLGIGKNAVYKLLNDNKISSFKIGSHFKITKLALLDYLQKSK